MIGNENALCEAATSQKAEDTMGERISIVVSCNQYNMKVYADARRIAGI